MYQPDDNDIDKVSREAADLYQAPGTPDWNSMQQRLDKVLPEEKEKKRRGFFFFFLIAGLTLAGIGTTLYYKNSNNVAKTTKVEKTTTAPAPGAVSKSQEEAPTAIAPAQNTAPIAGAAQQDQDPAGNAADKQQSPGNVPITARSNAQVQSKNDIPGSRHLKPAAASGNDESSNGLVSATNKTGKQHFSQADNTSAPTNSTKTKQPAGKRPSGKKGAAAAGAGVAATGNTTTLSGNDNTVSSQAEMSAKNETVGAPKVDSSQTALTAQNQAATASKEQPTKAKDSTASAKKKTTNAKEKSIFFGLVAGMDLSTVKFSYGQQPGYNIGVMAGYQFSPHWSAATGLIYTKKNYKLNGSDYHPPKHYWTQYVYLETVAGYCQMWELPLLVRYNFGLKPTSSFFVSTGLSSYFMKHQAYTYDYKNNQGVWGSSSFSSDSTFNHVFSILDLSAGFEKKIGKHISLQLEPYARIPLSGVGFGDIRLSSFGLNVNVLYHTR